MYEAKRTGRDRCVFAEGGYPAREGRLLRLARMLRGAETRGELSLVFQPNRRPAAAGDRGRGGAAALERPRVR